MKQFMKLAVALSLAAMLASGVAFAQDDAEDTPTDSLLVTAQSLFSPIPQEAPAIEGNVYSDEKELLGRNLWFDARLSASWFVSCNSCHNVGTAGVDLQPLSLGHAWQRGGRNSPTVFNAVFNVAQFWDGRADDLAQQAMGPIQDALEMANTPERTVQTLESMPGYVDMFAAAFPEDEDPVTFLNMARAIEIFESTLITPNSRFDQFLEGNTEVFTEQEREGLNSFIRRGCVACHQGVNLGGHGYYPFGVVERPDALVLPIGDVGRFGVTDVESDLYAFKSPTLRNIALTPPYFHSGVVWGLEDAVRIMGTAQLGAELSDQEVADITAFLHTLTGDQPQVTVPEMPTLGPNTPLPQPMIR